MIKTTSSRPGTDAGNAQGAVAGNALFLILIGVALFAALSYAITQSSRGSGNIGKETAELHAANLLAFSQSVTHGMDRLLLLNNVNITQIYFNNDTWEAANGSNFNGTMGSPADPSLYVFHPSGGGVTPLVFQGATTGDCGSCSAGRLLEGHFAVRWVAVPGVGSSAPELTLMGAQFSDEVCEAINRRSGMSPATVPDATIGGTYHAQGDPVPSSGGLGGAGEVSGKMAFCIYTASTSMRNLYIYVMQQY